MGSLHFLATARPKKENWLQNMTDEEKLVMMQHFAYANELFSQGNITFDGACLDGAMGLIVYKAESYEAALEMYENDPLVKSGILETEIHPFQPVHIQQS